MSAIPAGAAALATAKFREAEATKSAAMRAGGQENPMMAAPQEQKISVNAEHGGVKFEYTISDIDDGDGAFFFPEAWEKGGFGDAPSAPAGYPQLGEWRHKSGTVLITVTGAPEMMAMRAAGAAEDEAEAENQPPQRWAPGRTRRIGVRCDTADATFEMTMVEQSDDGDFNGTTVLEKIKVLNGTVTVTDPFTGVFKTVTVTAPNTKTINVLWSMLDHPNHPRKQYVIEEAQVENPN